MGFRSNTSAFVFQLPVYRDAREFVVDGGLESVLDVGCGNPQKLKAYLYPFVERIVGVDLPEIVEQIKERFGEWIGMDLDLEDLEDLGERFDLVIAADVIEHLKKPDNLFRFIRMHAHEDTLVLMSTPERGSMKNDGRGLITNLSHEREFSKDEVIDLAKENGFRVIRMKEYVEKNAANQYISNMFAFMLDGEQKE